MSFNRDSAKAAKAKQLSKKAEKKERNVAKFTKSQEKTVSEYFLISSQSDKTQTARNAKATKKLRAENNNLKRKIGKLEKKIKWYATKDQDRRAHHQQIREQRIWLMKKSLIQRCQNRVEDMQMKL